MLLLISSGAHGRLAVNGGGTLAPLHQHCPMLKCFRTIKQISVAPLLSLFFLLVAVAAGDFMVLSTLLTFIWRVAEGTLTLSFSSILPDAWSPCLCDCENVTWQFVDTHIPLFRISVVKNACIHMKYRFYYGFQCRERSESFLMLLERKRVF